MQNLILNQMVLFSQGVIGQKIEFYLKNWFFTSVKSAADALDDLCCCFSRLCWMQNLILNRMVPFLQGVIGKKTGFYDKNCLYFKKNLQNQFFNENPFFFR
jgi:hypothetical protein